MSFLDGLGQFFSGGGGAAAAGAGSGGGGSLLSRMGSGVHDFMHGTTPELNIQERPDIMDDRLGAIHQMPNITPTGNTTGGLLSKLQEPDARGLTFGDKLFAAGGVLQGDSGGAATYLANQRNTASAEDQRMTALRNARTGANAFRNNIGPDGQMNFKGYADAMGEDFDPVKALAMRKAMRPDITPMSGARGALYGFNHETGAFTPGVAGDPAPQTLFNPDNSINQGFVNGKAAEALAVARAQREGKPLAPRAGRAGARPRSYGSDEVVWGG